MGARGGATMYTYANTYAYTTYIHAYIHMYIYTYIPMVPPAKNLPFWMFSILNTRILEPVRNQN